MFCKFASWVSSLPKVHSILPRSSLSPPRNLKFTLAWKLESCRPRCIDGRPEEPGSKKQMSQRRLQMIWTGTRTRSISKTSDEVRGHRDGRWVSRPWPWVWSRNKSSWLLRRLAFRWRWDSWRESSWGDLSLVIFTYDMIRTWWFEPCYLYIWYDQKTIISTIRRIMRQHSIMQVHTWLMSHIKEEIPLVSSSSPTSACKPSSLPVVRSIS